MMNDNRFEVLDPNVAGSLSGQNDNVLFAQSRNVLLTTFRLGRWKKDNY